MAAPRPIERDILLTSAYEADDWGALDLSTAEDGGVDLAVAADGDALRQALLLRLLTPQGSLARLGHAAYGSRLHELIGQIGTPETRQLARLFVIQAVAQERRVQRILELTVQPVDQLHQERLDIFLRVQPAAGLGPVALGIEVAL